MPWSLRKGFVSRALELAVPWSLRNALELAEGVLLVEGEAGCVAQLVFRRGKRGRFHPQKFAKTCDFTLSDWSWLCGFWGI